MILRKTYKLNGKKGNQNFSESHRYPLNIRYPLISEGIAPIKKEEEAMKKGSERTRAFGD